MAPAPDLDAVLARLLERAQADLDAAAGGVALCVITRTGHGAPGVKYHEGRWAALREARRAGRRGEPVTAVLERWTERRDGILARGGSKDWQAYAIGGVEALEDALAEAG